MLIPANQVSYRKRIGTSAGKAVFGVGVIGGLHLVALHKDGSDFKILGAGSHRAVARYIAQRNSPDIRYDELIKSGEPQYADFVDILPKYEELTRRIMEIQG